MYCTKKVTDDLIWVFEGVYSVPRGVSYNSYLLLDDINVLFDTVDKAVSKTFFENLEHALNGRSLDFVVVQHMEPDHSATLMELLLRYPNAKVVCNQKILTMIKQFFQLDLTGKAFVVKEGDTLSTGHHTLKFVFAPMVHWPEVMVTFDETTGTLFSAYTGKRVSAMMQQRVDHRPVRVPRRGVDDKALRLVDDNHIAVFIADIERNLLRRQIGLLRLRKRQLQHHTGSRFFVLLERLPVCRDQSLRQKSLRLAAA